MNRFEPRPLRRDAAADVQLSIGTIAVFILLISVVHDALAYAFPLNTRFPGIQTRNQHLWVSLLLAAAIFGVALRKRLRLDRIFGPAAWSARAVALAAAIGIACYVLRVSELVACAAAFGTPADIAPLCPMPSAPVAAGLSLPPVIRLTDIANLVAAAFVGPFIEEFLFRGLLLRRLLAAVAAPAAIALSGLAFGLAHWDTGISAPFLIGGVMGYLYVRSGSLWLCIVAHAATNVTANVRVWLVHFVYENRESIDPTQAAIAAAGSAVIAAAVIVLLLRAIGVGPRSHVAQ